MDRKTKHRILGVLVIIGLVVILLPFFQSNRELPSEKLLVKAPPFPEQTTQIAQDTIVNDEIETNIPAEAHRSLPPLSPQDTKPSPEISNNPQQFGVPKNEIVQSNNSKEQESNKNTQETNGNQTASAPIQNVSPETVGEVDAKSEVPMNASKPLDARALSNTTLQDQNDQTQLLQENTKQDEPKTSKPETKPNLSPDTSDEEDIGIANLKETKKHSEITKTKKIQGNKTKITKAKTAAKTPFVPKVIEYQAIANSFNKPRYEPITNDGLTRLKNAAWVIQLGSFKNKTNAVRLVNQLRAKGYNAFIQHMNTSLGDTTRVFVGPLSKQEHARTTANQLATNMHLHGIVMSFKPLTI